MRAAVLVAVLVLVPSVHAAWPGFHNDARHTGFQSGTQYREYVDVWWSKKIDPATRIEASPVISDGYVVFAGWDGIVRVHDAASGAEVWTAKMAKIVGTPAITPGGKLFVVDTAGTMSAFELKSGFRFGNVTVGPTFSSPTINEGKVFIGNEAGVMKSYDTETLTLDWSFDIGTVAETRTGNNTCGTAIPAQGIRGSPVVYSGKVIFGSLNQWVYALNEKGLSGQKTNPEWIFKTNDNIFGAAAVDTANGRVLIGSYDEKVYSLPASPGGSGPLTLGNGNACSAFRNTPTWTFTVPASVGESKVQSTPAIDGTNAYFGANNGHVYAVTLSSGTKVWETSTGAAVISSPAVSNGLVVTGSDDGGVYWFRASNGTQVASFKADSAIKSSVALDGNKTFVVSFEGGLHMLGPKIPKRADLEVTAASYDDGVLSFVVRNGGDADAGASVLRVALDGTFLVDLAVPSIPAGSSATVTHELDLDGAHTITATADQALAVAESQESNNVFDGVVDGSQSSGGGGGGGKGGSIPGPGAPLLLAALAVALMALRRRR